MNKQHTTSVRYRSNHPSLLSSPVPDTAVSSVDNLHRQDIPINDHQQIHKVCHHHLSMNQHRNNHNYDFTQYDELSKSIINDLPKRKRYSDEKSSLISMYINNILLILIRLLMLFIIILMISCTFYYTIVYIYSKPKKNTWERIFDWFFQE